jgi:branched-chain amino acid aminotransferase
MNLFVFLKNEAGERELVTAPLDGVILPGVTRDSILHLTRSWKEFKVSERPMRMEEVTRAVDEGRMLEIFGAGTACVVTPVRNIQYDHVDYTIPLDPDDASSQAGPLTRRLDATIQGIQYGSIPYEDWSVIIN